jgi:hypothetical protein
MGNELVDSAKLVPMQNSVYTVEIPLSFRELRLGGRRCFGLLLEPRDQRVAIAK